VLRAPYERLRASAETVPGMRRFFRALTLVAHGFRGEAITLRASALTYLTLLSLVPLLAVVYSVVDLFTGEAQIHDRLQSYVNSQLGIGAGAAIAGALTTFTTRATIQTLGAIGFLALIVSVLWMLWNIESAFNHIYGVKPPRGPVQRILKYWSFLTLGPILLSASIYVTLVISQLNHGHGQAGHSEAVHALTALSSVAITYAGLAVLYKVVPNAKVRLRSALLAAFSAGTAWEVAKFLFAWASARMVQLHKIYGSLAVLPVTLTWIYISWSIALVGCRLCYALDASRKPEAHPALRGAAAREAFTARLLVALVQLHRHASGPLKPRWIAEDLGATPRMVREGLRALGALGLAAQTRKGGWLPSRDPSRITLAEMRLAGRASLPYPPRDADFIGQELARVFAQAEGAAESALTETLDSFLRRVSPKARDSLAAPLEVVQGVEKPA
jgi:membrane protein